MNPDRFCLLYENYADDGFGPILAPSLIEQHKIKYAKPQKVWRKIVEEDLS